MKFTSVCLLTFALFLTACADNKSAAPAPTKVARDANGNCTPEVKADLKEVLELNQTFLGRLAGELEDMADESKKDAAHQRVEGMTNELKAKIEGFRQTYGDFTCRDENSGQQISSAPLYKIIDDMNAKLNEPQKVPIAKDGECAAGFTADHKKMQRDSMTHLKALMENLPIVMRKVQSGLDSTAEQNLIRDASRGALGLIEGFRAKYPGEYACNLINERGEPQVVSSEEMDKVIREMRTNLNKLK